MFTGIITDIGTVRRIERRGDTRFIIATRYDMETVDIGASIACSGPCLTVVDKGPGWFAVDASAETQSKTTLGSWAVERRVNLERALKVGDELGGHIVTGHVDGCAEILSRRPEGDSLRLVFRAPAALARYIAPKGGVAIDGISLTVNEVEGDTFGINVISHTRKMTTLSDLLPGAFVNVEIDILARYIGRLQERA